jgi:hypothetical protein
VLRIFIALENPSPWPGFEPSTFGSSGQHTNHYTTEATGFIAKPRKPLRHSFFLILKICLTYSYRNWISGTELFSLSLWKTAYVCYS